MIVEYLTFEVAETERAAWIAADEATWSAFLSRQPGFLGKQLWLERGRPDRLHAIILWADEASWKAIPPAALAEVDRAMGALLRRPTLRVFEVVADTPPAMPPR